MKVVAERKSAAQESKARLSSACLVSHSPPPCLLAPGMHQVVAQTEWQLGYAQAKKYEQRAINAETNSFIKQRAKSICLLHSIEKRAKAYEHSSGQANKDEAMLQFIMQGFADAKDDTKLAHEKDPDLIHAIHKAACTPPGQLMAARENVVRSIEQFASEACQSGLAHRWLQHADAHVAKVSRSVNGPTLESLAKAIGYQDSACIEFFRKGAPLIGVLPETCNGVPKAYDTHKSIDELRESAETANSKLLSSLKEDKHSQALMTEVPFVFS